MPPLRTRIGAMRESLTLQRDLVTTSTGTGFSSVAWSTYATVPGEYVQPSGGREAWEGSAVTAELPTTFRIRDRSDVEPKDRLLWNGLIHEIHAVIPMMTVGRRFLLLQTGAGVSSEGAAGSPDTGDPATVILSWEPAEGDVEEYVLEVGSATGLSDVGIYHTGSAETEYAVSVLPAGTYFARAKAVIDGVEGDPSEEMTFTV